MASLLDFLGLGGGGQQLTSPDGGLLANFNGNGGSYSDIMNAINNNRGMIAGLGLGLLSGTKYNPYGNVLPGFMAGAKNDSLDAYRRAQLLQDTQDRAFKRQESARAQSNADRAYNFQVQQANKPQIHWPKEYEDEDGNRVQPPPVLVHPDGSITPVDPKMMPKVEPQANASPFTPPGEEDASLPPGAQLAQAGGPQVVAPGMKFRGPEAYRKEAYKEQAKADVTSQEKSDRGGRLLGIIDSLDQKIDSPQFKAISAANPMAGAAAEGSPLYNPARMAYELVGNRENKAMLDRIKQDAQALQLEFGNLYYKGQGAVSDRERAAVAELVGKITEARSPADAKALTANLRVLVQQAIQKVPSYNVPTGGGISSAPASSGGWKIEKVD